jgi:HK97 family phage prohead protease
MENHIEQRFLPIGEMRATKTEKGEMIIEGYPIVYDKTAILFWGLREIIRKGAATEALKTSNELVLWDHQSDQPMAAKKNGTLEAKEDDKGVFIRADVSKTSWGRDGFEAITNGVIDKMSFAFLVDENGGDSWHTELIDGVKTDVREIVRFKELFDYSPVAYPAYIETSVVARNIQIARSFREKSIPETSGEPDPKILTRTKARDRKLLLEENKFYQ